MMNPDEALYIVAHYGRIGPPNGGIKYEIYAEAKRIVAKQAEQLMKNQVDAKSNPDAAIQRLGAPTYESIRDELEAKEKQLNAQMVKLRQDMSTVSQQRDDLIQVMVRLGIRREG